jgi:AraC-like DNA-binding protein
MDFIGYHLITVAILWASATRSGEPPGLPSGVACDYCDFAGLFKRLGSGKYHAVVLDCGSKVGRGLALLKEIKKTYPRVAVLFVTDSGSGESVLKAFRLGALDYLKRPFSVHEFSRAVRHVSGAVTLKRRASDRGLPAHLRSDMPASLQKAVLLAERSFSERIDLERLASEAGVSRHHFCRVFKKHTGQSPMRFLTRLRMERAKELFRTTDMKVSAVANEVGFDDLSGFIKNFKRICGQTPGAFRKGRTCGSDGESLSLF